MELIEVYEALETLREFCLDKNGKCNDCELCHSPLCEKAEIKLKDLVFNDPTKPQIFKFFN